MKAGPKTAKEFPISKDVQITFNIRCRKEEHTDDEVLEGMLRKLKWLMKNKKYIPKITSVKQVYDMMDGADGTTFHIRRNP